MIESDSIHDAAVLPGPASVTPQGAESASGELTLHPARSDLLLCRTEDGRFGITDSARRLLLVCQTSRAWRPSIYPAARELIDGGQS